jgi:hypothetical protein
MQLSIQTDRDKLRAGKGLRFIAPVLPISSLHKLSIAKSYPSFILHAILCVVDDNRSQSVSVPAQESGMNFE